MYTHDIIVIGGGAGGLSVASGCAQLGMKTAIIEREHMGGDCLHFGCVPSKSLIHVAEQFAAAGKASRYTASPVTISGVNMQRVNEHIADIVANIAHHDSPERFRALGAQVFLGEAKFTGPRDVVVDGTKLSAKRIVVATGSRASAPPVPGLEETGYITNREIFSLSELPKSLLIMGAGPIGVELGQAFARLGSEVTIVDMAPRIMPRDDEELSAIVAKRIQAEGVRTITGASVRSVGMKNGKKTMDLRVGEDEFSISADQLLVAAGRRGNSDQLNIEAAGLSAGRGGFIPVNDRLQSAVKSIYVIGDANGTLPFTHVAGAEAALIIRRLALHAGGRMNYNLTPWVSYTDPELASVGFGEASAREAGVKSRVIRQSFSAVDRAHAEETADGLMKIVVDRRDRVIGVQIAAKGAGELIGPALHAVAGRWKVSKLRTTMTPYPTLGEIYGRAVGNELAPRLFNSRMRKILRLLFRYRGDGPSG